MPRVLHDIALGHVVLEGVKIGVMCEVHPSSIDRHVMDEVSNMKRPKSPYDPKIEAAFECVKKIWFDVTRFTWFACEALLKRLTGDEVADLFARGIAWETMNAGRPCQFYPIEDLTSAGIESSGIEHHQQYWVLEKHLQEDTGVEMSLLAQVWKNPIPDVKLPNLAKLVLQALWNMVKRGHVAETAMFATENGYIGSSASSSIAEGDIVYVLLGSKLPAVLRPQGDKYQLISFAYVHGIMNGEFVEESARTGREIEQFCIA